MAGTTEEFDIYDIQYMIADNAYRAMVDRKFRLERDIAQKESEMRDLMVSIEKFEKTLGILQSRTRVRY